MANYIVISLMHSHKHAMEKDSSFGRPKREGLEYIRSMAREKLDFQGTHSFKKPMHGYNIVAGAINSPWVTNVNTQRFQHIASMAYGGK
jgi:hypothetical protein